MEDTTPDTTTTVTVFTVITGILLSVAISFFYWLKSGAKEESVLKEEEVVTAPVKQTTPKKTAPAAAKAPAKKGVKRAPTSHPLYLNMLRGHTDIIVDMNLSQSGKLLATCSGDRTVRIWNIKDIEQGKDMKYTRLPLDNEAGGAVSISPDSKAVAVLLPDSNSVQIYRLGKKTGDDCSLILTIDNIKGDLKDVAIAPTGRFIMVSTKKTKIYVYTLKGELLHSIETGQSNNAQVLVSPCNDFIGSSGFTPEVHLWAVQYSSTKQGNTTSIDYKQTKEAMDLSGHKSGVYSFAFSGDCKKAVTVSKDGTWNVYNINVSWELKEDPKLLISGTVPVSGQAYTAMSPDGRVVAISVGTSVYMFNADTTELMETLEDIHQDTITKMFFSDTGAALFTAGKDKSVRVWLNRPGMLRDIEHWKESLTKATNTSHKDRLNQQITECSDRLAALRS